MLKTRLIIGSILIAALGSLLLIDHYTKTTYGFTILLLIVMPYTFWEFYRMHPEQYRRGMGKLYIIIFGLCYICLPMILIYHLRMLENRGEHLFIGFLAMVKAADTGAYFGGSILGGPKLAPKISPNKTISGLICGIAVGSLVGYLILYRLHHNFRKTFLCVFLISLVALLGDLFESAIKRYCGVKDSARLFPALGGMLDLVDSLLLSAPVAYILLLEF